MSESHTHTHTLQSTLWCSFHVCNAGSQSERSVQSMRELSSLPSELWMSSEHVRVCVRVCFKLKRTNSALPKTQKHLTQSQMHTGKQLCASHQTFNLGVQGSSPCSGAKLLGTAVAQSGGLAVLRSSPRCRPKKSVGCYGSKRFSARSTTEVPLSKFMAACVLRHLSLNASMCSLYGYA